MMRMFVLAIWSAAVAAPPATGAAVEDAALSPGNAALIGLLTIAASQLLSYFLGIRKAKRERLQEARGLAVVLASEIKPASEVLLAKAYALKLYVDQGKGTDPDDLLPFIELSPFVVFDANANRIHLLEAIQDFGRLSHGKGLVEQVVGFYEVVADLRANVAAAKLQNRKVLPEEIVGIHTDLKEASDFAQTLSKRLLELARLSKKKSQRSSERVQ